MAMFLALVVTFGLAAEVEATALAAPMVKRTTSAPSDSAPPKRIPNGEPPKRSCLSPSETREAVANRKLVAPYLALKTAAGRGRGETIGIRLCRLNDVFVYDITVLRRDGRVVKVIVEATTGRVVHLINDH